MKRVCDIIQCTSTSGIKNSTIKYVDHGGYNREIATWIGDNFILWSEVWCLKNRVKSDNFIIDYTSCPSNIDFWFIVHKHMPQCLEKNSLCLYVMFITCIFLICKCRKESNTGQVLLFNVYGKKLINSQDKIDCEFSNCHKE